MNRNTFDNIQLYFPHIIDTIDNDNSEYIVNNEGIIKIKNMKMVGLTLHVNYITKISTIKFSSKCLQSTVTDLISLNNIDTIYSLIAQYADLTYDEFLNASTSKIEITKDISSNKPDEMIRSMFGLSKYLKDYISPKSFYLFDGMPTSGYVKSNNKNSEYVEYFSYYIKLNEIIKTGKSHNSILLESLDDKSRANLLDYYRDKVRFELKLNSKDKIEQYFKLNKEGRKHALLNILNSDKKILKLAFEKIFGKAISTKRLGVKSHKFNVVSDSYILEAHNFDLAVINSVLKESLPTRQVTAIIKRMKQNMIQNDVHGYNEIRKTYYDILEQL